MRRLMAALSSGCSAGLCSSMAQKLLFQHAGSIMSQESSLAALNSLYQVIESRIATFNHALELSSCLDLLCAETFDDGVEENVVTPVIYEDEDESNDEASEDSLEVDTVQDGEEPAVYSDISDDKDNGELSD